ncbi:GntR family transcriptional regulator [Spongiactinospora sp. TRM90649]|uniref:GntR family transcriptional regulator n=1 Tax=Spongiactinospora sp. TRM90649 TaxID=3031114 RepID=UPI0023F8F704|nr:GntR family transcriptional regulator [Spongiactinospora sp. TRM90649]MDF5751688.1 GntR family transcriptional regulator [Spongiactinospora sp. TRM90649]
MAELLTGWRIYTQIADRLRKRIASGEYPPGALLPSEKALCRQFMVARNTVRRALAILADEGLIVTHAAKGREVAGGDDAEPYRYRLIARELREQIQRGELRTGSGVASEAELQRRYETSRNTVRRALAELERDGLIGVKQGVGRYVR